MKALVFNLDAKQNKSHLNTTAYSWPQSISSAYLILMLGLRVSVSICILVLPCCAGISKSSKFREKKKKNTDLAILEQFRIS